MAGDTITAIKMGKHIIELPDMYTHIDNGVETSEIWDDGTIEILDERPIIIRYEDGDYWIELKSTTDAADAAIYINESFTGKEPVARVPDNSQWAMSDEEDGSIEFYSDEGLMTLARTYGWGN